MTHCLLVTGLQRSGTSALAGIAHNLGIPMFLPGGELDGPLDLRDRYPRGNFEDREFAKIIWEATEGQPHVGRNPTRDMRRTFLEHFTPVIEAKLDAWFSERLEGACSGWFGVKLPVLFYAIKPLVRYLRERDCDPTLLLSHRRFEDVVTSVAKKRGEFNDPHNPQLWAQAVMSYNLWNLGLAESAARVLHVPQERFPWWMIMEQPAAVAHRIAGLCGVTNRPEAAQVVDRSLHEALS